MRSKAPAVLAIVLFIACTLAAVGRAVTKDRPVLPADAQRALSAAVGATGGRPGLRVLEVERIGPDFAVVYSLGDSVGTGLMVSSGEQWAVVGAPDPGALDGGRDGIRSTTLVADGLQVVFLAVPDGSRVVRLVVRFPQDGAVLTADRRGGYVVVWRPAATEVPSEYVVEGFDRRGRRVSP